ncbi:hypothetical protein [Zavarzinia sp. CC-PAN008]|uniref:hypothetical protein n=1 Tax=Zavarzinia sp. CC-PAN008 TaxID=3243332 RepID=UPI003F747CE2
MTRSRIEFIFMLTRSDRTVEDCLAVIDGIADAGLRHVGFKDVGAPKATLVELNRRIKATGARSYLEVVSTSPADSLASARAALEIGVDCVMGGTQVAEVLAILKGTAIAYLPFPGRPLGHPTKLGGSPDDIAADCRRYEAMGAGGVDLLAYRATEADPMDLVRAARAATRGTLVVAGNIDSPERIRLLADAGVDAFTVGSAAFDGGFSPSKGALRSQLADILAACA